MWSYHYGAQGEIRWLFPTAREQFTTDYKTEHRYDIPPGPPHHDPWFILSEPGGREIVYVVAAIERLHDLEILLTTYPTTPAAEQPALAWRIVADIRELRKRTLQAPAERSGRIGGIYRDDEDTVEIMAHHLYVKTYTIDHQ